MTTTGDAPLTISKEESMIVAGRILSEVPLIDGHNDFPLMIRGWHRNQVHRSDFDLYKMPIGQTDFTRLKQGQVGGQFWSTYISCPNKTDDFSDDIYLKTLRMTLQQIDLVHEIIKKYPEVLGLAVTAADIWTVFKSGRIASLIGVEGLHQIGNRASVLRMYHRLGVRYITLAHNSNNLYVDAATSGSRPHNGLSPVGENLIREMNRIGMIIDLSHTSEETQQHALRISRAPVIFSHSSCNSLCPSPRNTTDEVLGMLKQNGGVIMISFLRELTDSDSGRATLERVVDHIIYAGEKIGYRHVGIGSDFDGMLEGPEGLDDTSQFPHLVASLLRRGVTEDEVKSIVGLNIIRVLREVEEISQMATVEGWEILCDEIETLWKPHEKGILIERGQRRHLSMSGIC